MENAEETGLGSASGLNIEHFKAEICVAVEGCTLGRKSAAPLMLHVHDSSRKQSCGRVCLSPRAGMPSRFELMSMARAAAVRNQGERVPFTSF